MSGELVRTDDSSLLTGIKTDAVLYSETPGFRVTWIEWDSDFRNSGLQIQDLVVSVDGKSLDPFLKPGKMSPGIGQYGEYMYWQQMGAKPEQEIALGVLRNEGAEKLEIKGKIHSSRFYYDKQGRPALAPGGPSTIFPKDDFSDAWSGWYEKFVWKLSYLLDGAWDRQNINSRQELKEQEEHKERIDFLLKNYPGPFADAALADWTAAINLLEGKKADSIDLEYREIGAKRVELVKQEAAKAWNSFKGEISAQTIPAFPAAKIESRDQFVDKIVELPWITPRDNIINDLGKTYAVVGSQYDGYYFVLLSSPEVYRFYDAMYRYKAQVNPRLGERYQYVGRITDEPRMITFRGSPVSGLLVQALAGRAGEEEFFVDVRKTNEKGKSDFAGEAAITKFSTSTLPDDASPAQVMEEMIRAVKFADDASWKKLFADWRAITYDDGHSILDSSYAPSSYSLSSEWERSRQVIVGMVYDVRVDKVGRIRRIVKSDPKTNLPSVDEVVVFLDHYGLFDGEYRTFLNLNVHRRWTLQRLNEGPWKITSVQSV
ncbi:hypothetical protein [Candidatus Nitrososphaera evergladensis]|uniref:hypothetical protein n=1 Tax=Candidatus Nitrososphaera evergladensis TaxID=1459637 RepID=UPI0011E5ADE1|nr:hypothetical protein [Candidatus Nitrososphaera evergladensis]